MTTTNAARILSEDTPRIRAKGVHHQSVDSSNVKHWTYFPNTLELAVTFSGGEIYRYRNLGPKTWAALAKAKSKGEALARLVIDKFSFTKVN